ncbi:MAG TPA: hypothetical protein PLW65_06530 [Pseudomonadota bacterium]|nr:hypothetical protein [Pseudomonadota bacterium]
MTLSELADLHDEFVLVAGPNGSGKTTIADAYIKPRFPIWPRLNADQIADALQDNPALMSKPLEEESLPLAGPG